MRCRKCGQFWDGAENTCPQCGMQAVEKIAGVLKTSTILISSNNTEGVYRSVQEIPEPLRKKLLRSTNSVNSRTILIADQRGRQEIERAMRKLPGVPKRRRASALLEGTFNASKLPKLSITQGLGLLLAGASGVLVWLMLSHSW